MFALKLIFHFKAYLKSVKAQGGHQNLDLKLIVLYEFVSTALLSNFFFVPPNLSYKNCEID